LTLLAVRLLLYATWNWQIALNNLGVFKALKVFLCNIMLKQVIFWIISFLLVSQIPNLAKADNIFSFIKDLS